MLCLVIMMVLIGTVTFPEQPALAQEGDNLLENPGFEGTYVAVGGDPNLELAPGWQPWSLPPPPDAESSAINLQPDYQPAPANRVRSGSAAQEYNTFFATHDGGVFQRVPVSPGAVLEFSAFIYVWSSATFEDPNQSIQPQDVNVQVGIDPTGATDGGAATVVWSPAQQFYDEYRQVSISATSEANAVTVFVRTSPQGAIGVNNVYVDDAALIQTGQETPSDEGGDEAPIPTQEVEDEGGDTGTTDTGTTDDGAADDGGTTDDGEPADGTGDDTGTTEDEGTATDEGADDDEGAADGEADGTDTGGTGTGAGGVYEGLPNRLTYTVKAGDTLLSIAAANQSRVDAIVAANGINNTGLIFVGQTLVIPVPAGSGVPVVSPTPSSTATPTFPPAVNTITITVQRGETLYGIATRYGTTVETLAALNNITNPNLIAAGTQLRVPVSGTVPPPATSVPGGGFGTGGPLVHVVQPGENAFRIGLRYNITVETLALANRIANPNLIYVGQVLVIPQ
jgi:LysM repeat protein